MFSVVIPLYNKEATVARAIRSVLNQTKQPDEILVINDGSTDNGPQIVEQIVDSRLRLVHQDNAGVSAARNKGIHEAHGDWIAFLDADDEWNHEYLATMYKLLSMYPQCKVLACAYELENYQGVRKSMILHKIPFSGESGILCNYFQVATCSHPPLWSSAIIVEKEALKSVGGFPVGIQSGEDLLTWARLARKYEIAYCLKALAIFHVDISQEIIQKPTRLYDKNDPVGKSLISLYQESRDMHLKRYISHWYQMKASVYLRSSHTTHTVIYSIKSLRYNGLNYKSYCFLLMIWLPMFVQNKIKQMYRSQSGDKKDNQNECN